MSGLSFVKMHGCGNDYVFLEGFQQSIPTNLEFLARQLSNRHTGIGSDGLIVMLPPNVPGIDARMRMFNADGSEGDMCGNALRCMAMWLFQSGHVQQHFCNIAIGERIVTATVIESNIDQRRAMVSIDMGVPSRMSLSSPSSVAADFHGSKPDGDSIVQCVSVDHPADPTMTLTLACVSLGNPHAVVFVKDPTEVPVESIGRQLESHPVFPDRANIEFVESLSPVHARVRVWERGSGETMACGSGACAVAIAGISTGLFDRTRPIQIDMRGGTLQITWLPNQHVNMLGPAVESFRGHLNLSSIAQSEGRCQIGLGMGTG